MTAIPNHSSCLVPKRPRWWSALVVVAFPPLVAQTITDDFDDGNDTGWTRAIPLQEVGGSATYSFPNGNSYRIVSAASPNPESFGPARAGAFRADVSYDAFRIEVDLIDWDTSLNQDIGILARVSSPGLGTLDGYAWSYQTGGATVYFSRLDREAPATLSSAPVTLTPGESYRFVLEGFGGEFCGQIFHVDNLDDALVTVFGFDGTHASGYGGFFNNSVPAGGTTDTTFDNYRSSIDTDVDKDGMTDQWEIDYFGDLFWFDDEDFDGDRQTNLEEFIGGSDPTDPASLSGLGSVQVAAGEIVVRFRFVEGRSYALETSPDLVSWTAQPAAVFATEDGTGSLTLPLDGQPAPLFVRVLTTVE